MAQWLGISRDQWVAAALSGLSIVAGLAVVGAGGVIPRTGAALLWALACLSVGTLVGLVFGIPRAAARSRRAQAGAGGSGVRRSLEVNTNMEQISDWLTKLLVGAGLVELKALPYNLDQAARYVSAGLGGEAHKSTVAALLLYFTLEGFFVGYIGTRLFFQVAFLRADQVLGDVPHRATAAVGRAAAPRLGGPSQEAL